MNNNKTFEEECRAIAIEVAETLIEKHKEYGVDNIIDIQWDYYTEFFKDSVQHRW